MVESGYIKSLVVWGSWTLPAGLFRPYIAEGILGLVISFGKRKNHRRAFLRQVIFGRWTDMF